MVWTSLGLRIGTARAIASRSLIRRTDFRLRFSSWARDLSSIIQGKLVAFTRPPITGPATAKHARSTGLLTLVKNSFTITCRLE